MGFLKNQFLKVIELQDNDRSIIAQRYIVEDRKEIMKNSRLVVREGQMAIFVVEGKIADVFTPGTYKLDDAKNIPIITEILAWKYLFESPYKGDVYYINTTQFVGQKWGTQNPIPMRDKEFGMVRLRGFGAFSFKVNNPEVVLKELIGTKDKLLVEDVMEQFKKYVVSHISDAIAESKLAALDLAMNYLELSSIAKDSLSSDFEKYGFDLTSFVIENLSVPEEVEKAMDTRTQVGIMGDKMGEFVQFQSAHAIRESANNKGNNFAGMGVGMGAGLGLGHMFTQSIENAKRPASGGGENEAAGEKCIKCKAQLKKGAKFCPECGAKQLETVKCTKCNAEVPANVKFCPECGAKAGAKTCAKCGVETKANTKFCSGCGEPVSE